MVVDDSLSRKGCAGCQRARLAFVYSLAMQASSSPAFVYGVCVLPATRSLRHSGISSGWQSLSHSQLGNGKNFASGSRPGHGRRSYHQPARLQMVFLDFLADRKRSELETRTYASDPSIFKVTPNMLDHKDPTLFVGRKVQASVLEAWGKLGLRLLFLTLGYMSFPDVVRLLQPVVYQEGGPLSDEVHTGLTSSFLPGISLLFGSLFSYTIGILVARQQQIELLVNKELADLGILLYTMMDLLRGDDSRLLQGLVNIWRHTDQLIFQSRYQEIMAMARDDPIIELIRLVNQIDDPVLQTKPYDDSFATSKDTCNFLRPLLAGINQIRTQRMAAEGAVLPTAHFAILALLAGLLLVGFTLASVQQESGGTGVAFESRVLFTLLLAAFSFLIEFCIDLTNPFTGGYRVRRTTTTAWLINIRSAIAHKLGPENLAMLDMEGMQDKEDKK